MKANQLTLI